MCEECRRKASESDSRTLVIKIDDDPELKEIFETGKREAKAIQDRMKFLEKQAKDLDKENEERRTTHWKRVEARLRALGKLPDWYKENDSLETIAGCLFAEKKADFDRRRQAGNPLAQLLSGAIRIPIGPN